MGEGKANMFGKTYNTIGSTDSNFIIKTKGDLKIQWGGKFIDVVKNGKLASSGVSILKQISSSEEISGDGVYLIPTEVGNEVWVSIGGTKVNVAGEVGTTYVSFLAEQKEITADQKYTALTNAGFYYETLDQAQQAGIKAGLIYVVGENKLYLANNGQLSEYTIDNSTTSNKTGKFDELIVKELKIYDESTSMTISSPNLLFKTSQEQAMLLDQEVKVYLNLVMQPDTYIQSLNATPVKGYRLYVYNSQSYLEVDNLTIRKSIKIPTDYIEVTISEFKKLTETNGLEKNKQYKLIDFRNFWEMGVDEVLEKDATEEKPANVRPLIVTAKNKTEYYKDECFFEEDKTCIVSYDVNYNKQYTIPDRTVEALGLITRMRDASGNECNYNFRHLKFLKEGVWVSTFQGEDFYNNQLTLENIRVEQDVDGTTVVFEDLPNYATFISPCSDNVFKSQDAPLEIHEIFNENTVFKSWNNVTYTSVIGCTFKEEVKNVTCTAELNSCIFEDKVSDTKIQAKLTDCIFQRELQASNITAELYRCTFQGLVQNANISQKANNCEFKREIQDATIASELDGCIFEYAIKTTNLFEDTTLVFRNCQFLQTVVGDIEAPDATIRELLQSDEPKNIMFVVEEGIKKLRVTLNSVLNIPSGAIIMWHGSEIPYGWAICDGTNGTPNLIGKFIKAVDAPEKVGDNETVLNEKNELTLTKEYLPKHNHPHNPHTHNLSGNASGYTGDSGDLALDFKWSDYNYGINYDVKSVVTSVTGEGVTSSTGNVNSVSNIYTQGGQALGGDHYHSISLDADSMTVLSETSTEQTLKDEEWPNKPIKIEPRSYSLIFIMKL